MPTGICLEAISLEQSTTKATADDRRKMRVNNPGVVMYQARPVSGPDEQERFCALPGLSTLNADILARQRPDASWMLADDAGRVAARCSLWWSVTPAHTDHRLGLIGHYAIAQPEAAAPLLQLACEQLAAHGCTLAVGPMDGNTWQRYRLLTERGTEPIFFLEPDNPDDWPGHFRDQEFTALAQYYSALNTALDRQEPRIEDIAERVAGQGITLRPLAPNRFEVELRAIHALSLESFRDNLLYTPIGVEDFVAQYRGIQPYVRPELVFLAERQGRLVGFLFAIPNLLQAQRGAAIDTIIIKTMAVHPDCGGIGFGSLLMARCHEMAHKLGYTRAIHALMHEDNRSRKISSHTARPIRRYTLFAKPLP
jgi:GNAT superfamily N-acetyltransferase